MYDESHELLTAMTAAAATRDYATVTTKANELLDGGRREGWC